MLQFSRQVDFAIFAMTLDDEVQVRGEAHVAVRDNVLFEVGLFYGALGQNRVSNRIRFGFRHIGIMSLSLAVSYHLSEQSSKQLVV